MSEEHPYVSRGGVKLAAALDQFGIDVKGCRCADFGSNAGGFTDCLLQRGAAGVYAIDTGYGTLAWKLRQDNHIVTLERTNVLHFDPQSLDDFGGCELVVIDLGWTRQSHAVPAALRWLSSDDNARIVTLIKPHYESDRSLLNSGVLDPKDAEAVCARVLAGLPALGVEVLAHIRSPILGGAGKGRAGTTEYLALLKRHV